MIQYCDVQIEGYSCSLCSCMCLYLHVNVRASECCVCVCLWGVGGRVAGVGVCNVSCLCIHVLYSAFGHVRMYMYSQSCRPL